MQLDIFCPSNENGIDIKTLMEKNKRTSSSTLKALTRCCIPAITDHLTVFQCNNSRYRTFTGFSWIAGLSGAKLGGAVWVLGVNCL